MNILIRYIKLYFYMFKINIKVMLEYRADFIIALITNIPIQMMELLFIWAIFLNINSLKGWSFYEITLIYGIMLMSKGICETFFNNLFDLGKGYLKSGKFDVLLTKPMNSLFGMISSYFYAGAIGNFIIGITIITISINKLQLAFGITKIVLLLFFILCGGAIFGAIQIIASCLSFWTVESLDIMWASYSVYQFALYPITLYTSFIKFFITFIMPYAFASYYPAVYFLGRADGYMVWFSPLITIALWIIGIKLWNFGLKNYSSTGS